MRTGEAQPPPWPVLVKTMEAGDDVAGAEEECEGEDDEGEEGEGEEGEEVDPAEEVDPVEEVADSARSDEERLAAARRAWDREQASGCAITVDHVHTGRCLAAVKRHRSYRKEGASTFAAWTQQHMGIGRFMARFYVMAGAVTLKAVRRRVLSVEKLALLSELPPGLQPELARLGERLSRQRLRVVVKAATASLARSPDQRAALCAAVAVAEEQEDADAVCAAPVCAELMPEVEQRLAAAPARGAVEPARARACECVRALQRELMALQGPAQGAVQAAAPLARIDAQQRQLGEALGALRAALAGLSRLNISGEKESDPGEIAKRGAPQTAGLEAGAAQGKEEDDGEGRAVGGTPADEAPGEVEGTLDETESEAQGEAPDDEEDRGLDDEKGRGLDDGEDDQEDAGAPAPTDRAPASVCVTTQELARALLAGLAEAEQAQLSNAFLGVLSRHNEPCVLARERLDESIDASTAASTTPTESLRLSRPRPFRTLPTSAAVQPILCPILS